MVDWHKIQAIAHSELANPLDTLGRINKALDMVLEGCETEKATANGDVVSLTEKLPSAVAQLVRAQLQVLKYIDQHVAVEPVAGCELIIGEWYEQPIGADSSDNVP